MNASFPLRRIALGALAVTLLCAQQNAGPKFEVASLKPTEVGNGIIHPAPGGQRYEASGVTLKRMIETAYRIDAKQIIGGPDWLGRDRFDLEAKSERPSNADELREMLKALLAERCQLRYRMETKELPAYLLTAGEGPSKLTPHEPHDGGEPAIVYSLDGGKPLHIKLEATAASLDYLAWRVQFFVDRPMLNQTGLPGSYDFVLRFTIDPPASMHEGMLGHNGVPYDFSGPRIAEAVRQQLGLRVKEGKGPVEVMSILHVEKPSGN